MVTLLYYYTVYVNNRKYTIIDQKKYNSLNWIVYKGLPSPSIRKTRQKWAGIVSKKWEKRSGTVQKVYHWIKRERNFINPV